MVNVKLSYLLLTRSDLQDPLNADAKPEYTPSKKEIKVANKKLVCRIFSFKGF